MGADRGGGAAASRSGGRTLRSVASSAFTLQALGQYLSLLPPLVSNVVMARVMQPEEYGLFVGAYSLALFAVGLTDKGWNVLLAGKALDPHVVVLGKTLSGVVTVPAIAILTAEAFHGSWVLAVPCAALGALVAVFGFYDSALLAAGLLGHDAVVRSVFAIVWLVALPLAAFITGSASSALVAAVSVYVCAILAGWFAWRGHTINTASPSARKAFREGGVSLLVALAIQLPGNLVSNGVLALASGEVTLRTLGSLRITILALGLVLASAPMGVSQMAAAAARSGTRARHDRRRLNLQIWATMGVVVCASLLAATLGPTLVGIVFGHAYVIEGTAFRALMLTGPALYLTYLLVPLHVALGRKSEAAISCALGSILGGVALFVLLPLWQERALAPSLDVAAAVMIAILGRKDYWWLSVGTCALAALGLIPLLWP